MAGFWIVERGSKRGQAASFCLLEQAAELSLYEVLALFLFYSHQGRLKKAISFISLFPGFKEALKAHPKVILEAIFGSSTDQRCLAELIRPFASPSLFSFFLARALKEKVHHKEMEAISLMFIKSDLDLSDCGVNDISFAEWLTLGENSALARSLAEKIEKNPKYKTQRLLGWHFDSESIESSLSYLNVALPLFFKGMGRVSLKRMGKIARLASSSEIPV